MDWRIAKYVERIINAQADMEMLRRGRRRVRQAERISEAATCMRSVADADRKGTEESTGDRFPAQTWG